MALDEHGATGCRQVAEAMSTSLLLSLFPGIGLFDRAFEETGACVVRGPDLLWGGDIRAFHPPPGRFDGVFGGPPCQRFSRLANIVRAVHGEEALAENLIPEFERVVREAEPAWFVMENVPAAPEPVVDGYDVVSVIANNRWFGAVQNRERRFSFGTRWGGALAMVRALRAQEHVLEPAEWEPAVCSSAGGRRASVRLGGSGRRKQACLLRPRTVAEEAVLQGLPAGFLDGAPFTVEGKREAIGNGVPLPLGRAVANAVIRIVETRSRQLPRSAMP